MNQVPHITIEQHHITSAVGETDRYPCSMVEICNKAIEIALAEQKKKATDEILRWAGLQEQPLITAEEARKLGAGKAEYLSWNGDWVICEENQFKHTSFVTEKPIKYRAIKQPEPVEPTCQVRNDDTGKTETMTREKAKLLQAETMDICDWLNCGLSAPQNMLFAFDAIGIYTYKLKANLVKLDGELMTREAAIVKWESRKDTCDCYVSTESRPMWEATKQPSFSRHDDFGFCEYQIRAKPLKQVSWKDVPVGVMTNKGELRYFNPSNNMALCEHGKNGSYNWEFIEKLTIAPASEQRWIAMQDNQDFHDLARKLLADGFSYSFHANRFKITGLAEGYKLK